MISDETNSCTRQCLTGNVLQPPKLLQTPQRTQLMRGVVLHVVVLVRVPSVPHRVRNLRTRASVRVPPDVRKVVVPVRTGLLNVRQFRHRGEPFVILHQRGCVVWNRKVVTPVVLENRQAVRPGKQGVINQPRGLFPREKDSAVRPGALAGELCNTVQQLLEPRPLFPFVLSHQNVVVLAAYLLVHPIRGDAVARAFVWAFGHDRRCATVRELIHEFDAHQAFRNRRLHRAEGRVPRKRRLADQRGDHTKGVVFNKLRGFEVVPVFVLCHKGRARRVARARRPSFLPPQSLDPVVRHVAVMVLQRQSRAVRERAEPGGHVHQVRLLRCGAHRARQKSGHAGAGVRTRPEGQPYYPRVGVNFRHHRRKQHALPDRLRGAGVISPLPIPHETSLGNPKMHARVVTPALALDPEYWRALCPALHVGDDAFMASVKPMVVRGEIAQDARARLTKLGFTKIPGHRLNWRKAADHGKLARAVLTLLQHGWNPSWVLVYDEAWAIVQELSSFMYEATGNRINHDALVWHVSPHDENPTAFSPHRDRQPEDAPSTFREDGSSMYTTAWVPLTDATTENSCLCFIPRNQDPGYYAGDDDDPDAPPEKTDPLRLALPHKNAYQHITSVPAECGSVVVFTHRHV